MSRCIIRILGCYLMLLNPVFAADALQQVMQVLAKVNSSEVRYQEEKHLAMLDLPLVQTGSLNYVAPDQFSRTLDGPTGTVFKVQGDYVTVEKASGSETRSLHGMPLVKAFFASFGATLAGDLSRLQQYYEVSFSGALNAWRVELTPRDTELLAYVSEIKLWGNHDRIKGMEIYEPNGDWSRMILLHD